MPAQSTIYGEQQVVYSDTRRACNPCEHKKMRKKRFRPRDRNSLKLPAQSPVTPFVNCDATSEGEPAPTSDKVEKAAMTDDLRSFNIYTRHTTPPPPPPSQARNHGSPYDTDKDTGVRSSRYECGM